MTLRLQIDEVNRCMCYNSGENGEINSYTFICCLVGLICSRDIYMTCTKLYKKLFKLHDLVLILFSVEGKVCRNIYS